MTISRAQMRRQLYMGGGIASLEPRQQYGLGSIVKSVTKAVKGVGDAVGDIVSSDAGKLALLAAGGYYLGGGQIPGLSKFLPAMKYGNAAGTGFGFGNILPNVANIAGFTGTAEKLATMGTLGKGAAILGGSALLTSLFGSPDQAQEAFNRDPGYVKSALAKYYRNINKGREGEEGFDEEVQNFVNQNILEFGDVSRSDVVSGYEKNIQSNLDNAMYAAEGGRVGLANGGLNTFGLYQNYLNELQDAQQQSISSPLYNPTVSYQTADGDENSNFGKQDDVETGNLNKGAGFRETMNNIASNIRSGNFNIGNALKGGIALGTLGLGLGYTSTKGNPFGVEDDPNDFSGGTGVGGGTPGGDGSVGGEAGGDGGVGGPSGPFADGGIVTKISRRDMMGGGIPGIPMGEPRQNAQGIQELDYRQEGGFVPVGIKEKADDVPAMLSRNEFVMTADAVRGMGNGSIENGAQKMYNLMKSLENRIA